ncbi:hypothetical protein Droror1_Dr00003118 [Drosera rotundifolia]
MIDTCSAKCLNEGKEEESVYELCAHNTYSDSEASLCARWSAATYLPGVFIIIKAFLDPSLSLEDMKQGVSFASTGSGYNPDAAQAVGALSLPQQLDNFSKYQAQLEASIGANETQKLVKEAIYVVSMSSVFA